MKTKRIYRFSLAFLVLLIMSFVSTSYAQTEKYDYAEVIVVQKLTRKPIKRVLAMFVNAQTGDLKTEEISFQKTKNVPNLMRYMNEQGWEFVDRISWGAQSLSWSGYVWESLIFRKKK